MDNAGHIDVLEQRDSARTPLVASIGLHAALFAAIFAWGVYNSRGRENWGDPHGLGGGSWGVTAVKTIPLPPRGGEVNRIANDTESTVPAAPKPEPKRAPVEPPPDAIPLKGRAKAQQAARPFVPRAYSYKKEYNPNQLYSRSGAALNSEQFGAITGSGGVGIGPGNAFGTRFGWYRAALEQAIAAKWHPEDVGGGRTGQPVILVFDIVKPNQARGVRIMQSSGNRQADYAAQRAVMEASLPPLPPQYERDSAEIEIWFQVKR